MKPGTISHGKVKIFLGSLFFLTILSSALAFSYAQANIFKNSSNNSVKELAVFGVQGTGQEADAIVANAGGATDPAQLFVYDSFGNCLPRRANGHFIISLGQVVFVQIKGDSAHPITDSQLTSTNPPQTTLSIQWSGSLGTSHKITFLKVPVMGTGSNRATAMVPWIAGNFTSTYPSLLPAGVFLPSPTVVSPSLSDTSGTVVTASEIAAITNQCTLATKYGNPNNKSFVQPSDPPFSATCGSTFGVTSGKAPNPIGHMNWNSSPCEGRDCPTCPTGITPTMVTSGTQTTLSIQDPIPGITYTWSLSAGMIQGSNVGTSIIWTAPTVATGTAVMVEIIASNPATGCIAPPCKYTITVNPNNGCPTITVTVTPSSATICKGGFVELTATATGGIGPYIFTWSPGATLTPKQAGGGDETITTDATGDTVTGPTVIAKPEVTTTYTVVATDIGDNRSCSGTGMATVYVNTAPVVTENPDDQEVCSGETVSFTAEANGIPDPSVQWQVSTDGGINFTNLNILTATSNTLSFTADAFQNGYRYRAVFSNECGMTPTTAATLTVNTPPVITTQPSSLSVCLGTPATFTVSATGKGPFSYQWYRNNLLIPGANNSFYTIASASFADAGSYYVVVSNECGSTSSDPATLGVYDFTVSISPSDKTVLRGNSATYTVSANLVNGSTGAPQGVLLSQITGLPADAKVSGFPSSLKFGESANFTIETNTLGDFTFSVMGSTSSCSRTATATLHVFDFTVGLTPDSQTVLRGCSKAFDVAVNLVTGSSTFDLPKVSLSVVFTDKSTTNITATFGTASSTPPFVTKLFLSPNDKSSLGTFSFNVVGTADGGGSRQSFTSTLGVYDFSISATPNPLIVAQNQLGSYNVVVKLEPGSATPPPIDLIVSTPSGITGKLTDTKVVPTLDGVKTYLLVSPTAPATLFATGNYNITITGTDPGDSSCFRSATVSLIVVAAKIGGKMRDTGCNDIPNGFDAVFTPAGSSLKLNATNPGGFMYNTSVTVGTASKVSLVINIPTDTDDAQFLKGLPPGSASFVLYGSRPVHIYTSDPCAPGAVDITPNDVLINTPTGSLLQPLSNNLTPVKTIGSVMLTNFSVPAGATIWVQVHIRSALLDTVGWPQDSQTTFLRSYQFSTGYTFDNLTLSTLLVTNFTGTGKRVTGLGGYAVDLNAAGKGGLKVTVTDSKGAVVANATTEKYTGFFFANLPANTSGSVQLFNAMGNQIGTQKFGTIAQDLFVQLNFLNLSPADPVIEGIVGTVDSGVANTRLELINVGGHVVSTTQTNSGGYYVFRFPAPGTYTVRITPPDGFRASTTSTTVKIKMFEELQVDFLMNR
jgi:hypothetical protein